MSEEHNNIRGDAYHVMQSVCPVCEHNRIYHIHIKEMAVIVCKIRGCKCYINVPDMMKYTEKLMEELR